MISERSKPPQVMKLENNYTFKLTSENECVLSNFYSDKENKNKKCLICWKKMCNCSNCSKKYSVISTCCNQTYHYKCFNKWMKTRNVCPICKGLLFLVKEKSFNKETKLNHRKYITCTYKLYNGHGEEVNIQNAFQLNDEYEDPALFDDSENEPESDVPENNVLDSDVSEDNIENDIRNVNNIIADNDNIEYEDATGDGESNIDDDDDIRSYYSDILDYLPHRSSMNLNNSNTENSVYSI